MSAGAEADLPHGADGGAVDEINAAAQAYVACPPRYVKWISKILGLLRGSSRIFSALELDGSERRPCSSETIRARGPLTRWRASSCPTPRWQSRFPWRLPLLCAARYGNTGATARTPRRVGSDNAPSGCRRRY